MPNHRKSDKKDAAYSQNVLTHFLRNKPVIEIAVKIEIISKSPSKGSVIGFTHVSIW